MLQVRSNSSNGSCFPTRQAKLRLEAPPGFEPGVEVLQSHPWCPSRAFRTFPNSRRNCCDSKRLRHSGEHQKNVPLGKIGCRGFAAGTVSGTPRRCELLDALPDFSPKGSRNNNSYIFQLYGRRNSVITLGCATRKRSLGFAASIRSSPSNWTSAGAVNGRRRKRAMPGGAAWRLSRGPPGCRDPPSPRAWAELAVAGRAARGPRGPAGPAPRRGAPRG